MHITKNDIPVKINAPGAVARHLPDFGVAAGSLAAEYFSLGAGADLAPLLQGLTGDACQAAHWGYMISGEVVVTYTDGSNETCTGGDVFYWHPGHSVRVSTDAELILFSPQEEHAHVLEHIAAKMAAV
ncbi:MAG: cupin domain-containing protein [Actinomycetota bacterium]|nr:cupin domain-containing protein [Actinomycetota bacterium]